MVVKLQFWYGEYQWVPLLPLPPGPLTLFVVVLVIVLSIGKLEMLKIYSHLVEIINTI